MNSKACMSSRHWRHTLLVRPCWSLEHCGCWRIIAVLMMMAVVCLSHYSAAVRRKLSNRSTGTGFHARQSVSRTPLWIDPSRCCSRHSKPQHLCHCWINGRPRRPSRPSPRMVMMRRQDLRLISSSCLTRGAKDRRSITGCRRVRVEGNVEPRCGVLLVPGDEDRVSAFNGYCCWWW